MTDAEGRRRASQAVSGREAQRPMSVSEPDVPEEMAREACFITNLFFHDEGGKSAVACAIAVVTLKPSAPLFDR